MDQQRDKDYAVLYIIILLLKIKQVLLFHSLVYKVMLQNKVLRQLNSRKSKLGLILTKKKQQPPIQHIKTRLTEVKQKIDSLLERDFSFLRTHQTQGNQYQKLQISKSNELVKDYIFNNYQQYGLRDPLTNLQSQQISPSRKRHSGKTNQKLYLYSANKAKTNFKQAHLQDSRQMRFRTEPNQEELRYVSTKKRLNPQAYSKKQSKTDNGFSHFRQNTKTTQPYLETLANEQKRQESHYKTLPSEFQNTPLDSRKFIESHYINQVTDFKNFEREEMLPTPIKYKPENTPFHGVHINQKPLHQHNEKLRYCIGCERALLQINIDFHERVCQEFKYAFSLSFVQLKDYAQKKVVKLEAQLKNYHQLPKNTSKVNQLSIQLAQASQQIRKTGMRTQKFLNTYNSILESSRMKLEHLQKLSKLNWFLQIYQNIGKKLNI